jgi:NAD+ kinase
VTRRILLVAHPRRPEAQHLAGDVAARLHAAGIEVALLPEEAEAVHLGHNPNVVLADPADPAHGCELVCVLGGDGTILRGAAMSRGTDAPLLGVNLGHVGFLAEAEREDLQETVERIVSRDYEVEERMTLEVRAHHDGELIASSWALNEVTVEKAARERMLELIVEVDGRPLSTWGCDGVVMATPTGSTAYAFSAGGPVVWPDVEAMLVVPLAAHALFARPLVVGPRCRLAVEVLADTEGSGVLWCDGARMVELPPGARIEVCRSDTPVRLARMSASPFTDRLVAKFDLSVAGWRGAGRRANGGPGPGRRRGSGHGPSTGGDQPVAPAAD